MSRYLSERYKSLQAYVPGEQPADMRYIKLNTNESPYPPSPRVLEAINGEEVQKLNLYPNPDGARLIQKLAEFYGVGRDNVIIGNGSDELLAFAFLAFCGGGRGAVFPDITYGFYPVYASLFGISYEAIPLSEDLTIRASDYFNAGRNVVIANPNAPTGIALALPDIEEIIRNNQNHVVLVDEAYVDFGAESAIPLIEKYGNLLVTQTYSKSRSMAGARLAYAVGQAPLIEDLNKMKYSFNPYNVNRLTQFAGEAALLDGEYYRKMQREIIKTREYTQARLKELGFEATESSANFVFARHPGIEGYGLYTALKEKGILVRHFDKPRISDHLRITIGTKEQMETLFDMIITIFTERGLT